MLAQNRPNRPKENCEGHHANAQSKDHVIEHLVVQRAIDLLKDHEGIIDVRHAVPSSVFHKSHFLRAINGAEEHGAIFSKMARLAVFFF